MLINFEIVEIKLFKLVCVKLCFWGKSNCIHWIYETPCLTWFNM